MIPRKAILNLVLAAIILPIIVMVVMGVARLLSALGDATGALWLTRVAFAGGLIWSLDLILLLIALGVNSAASED